MGGPGGGGDDLTIGVGATVSGFQQGMSAASQSMLDFATTVTTSTAAMQSAMASLSASFASFSNGMYGMNQAQQGFQSQTQNTASSINDNLIGGFTKFAFSVNQGIQFLGNMKDVLGGVADLALRLPQQIMAIPFNFLQQNLGMPSLGAMPDAALNESWRLNVDTQKNLGTWRFLYGKGGLNNTPDPTAQDLMQWTSTASFNMPYTRQDMISAITALGRMGLSEQQVKDFLPTVSDLGILNPDRNLTQAAFAVQGAMHGYTRMLRYDYGIDPRQLEPFGLQISGMDTVDNPDQILPALQKWEQARGIAGGSKWASQNTWWGEWSSFQDRIQNVLLEAGGTDLNGNVRQGSLFSRMQGDLKNLTGWMDQPQNTQALFKWADIFQNALGGGVKIATNAVQGFFAGMQQSGTGNMIFEGLKSLGDWINSPATASALQNIGSTLGRLGGPLLQSIGGAIGGIGQGLQDSGVGQVLKDDIIGLGKWFADPQHQADLKNFFTELATATGDLINFASAVLNATGGLIGWISTQAADVTQSIANSGPGDWFMQQILRTYDTKTLQLMVAQNPYDPALKKRGDDPSIEVDAYKELLSRLGYDSDQIDQMTNAWLAQEYQLQMQVATGQIPTGKAIPRGAGPGGTNMPTPDDPYFVGQRAQSAHTQGTTDANAYLDAFHQQVQKSNPGGTFATLLSTQFTSGLQTNTGAFATAMSNAMTAVATQVVTAILQQMATSTNAASRIPGGKTSALAPGVS